MDAPPKILWHSNAPWAPSGYGVQTQLFAPRIQGLGYDVAVSCLYGLQGGLLTWPGPRGPIQLYPQGFDAYGADIIPPHCAHYEADLLITLIDAWVLRPDSYPPKTRFAPWFPVDMEPMPEPVRKVVSQAHSRLVFSRSAEKACHDAGMDCEYVPHGFDGSVMKPGSDGGARRDLGVGDRWMVGVVAANKGQPPRKSWLQIFEGFKLFHELQPDTVLYVHTHAGMEMQGLDLVGVANHIGVPDDAIIWCNGYQNFLGYAPDQLAMLYRAMDCLLLPTMGEGFGVPIVEAQACGTPVVVGDWTAMPEVCRSGIAIPKSGAMRELIHSFAYQWKVFPESIRDALVEARAADYGTPAEISGRVQEYEADYVTEHHWKPTLEKILAKPPIGDGRMPAVGLNRAERRKNARQKARK